MAYSGYTFAVKQWSEDRPYVVIRQGSCEGLDRRGYAVKHFE